MAKNFDSLFRSRDGRVTLELAGEIDGSAAAEVCYRIQMLGVRECALDFTGVEAIDVFGACVLGRGLKSLRSRGVCFEVESLPERVAGTLCLGGVLEAIA
ncbi:MAG: STAS domain-containing protein [Candidatus Methylomirabilota bacterium]